MRLRAEKEYEHERAAARERARQIRSDLEQPDSDAEEEPWMRKPIATRYCITFCPPVTVLLHVDCPLSPCYMQCMHVLFIRKYISESAVRVTFGVLNDSRRAEARRRVRERDEAEDAADRALQIEQNAAKRRRGESSEGMFQSQFTCNVQ